MLGGSDRSIHDSAQHGARQRPGQRSPEHNVVGMLQHTENWPACEESRSIKDGYMYALGP